MKRRSVSPRKLLCLLAFGTSALVSAGGSDIFKTDNHGFSMLVPSGVKIEEHNVGSGWSGLHFKVSETTQVWVHAKQGFFDATPNELRKLAVNAADIPATYWTPVKELTGILGVASEGDFVIFLASTEADYLADMADFERRFASIRPYQRSRSSRPT